MYLSRTSICCHHWAVNGGVACAALLLLVTVSGCEEPGSEAPQAPMTLGKMITYVDGHQPIEPLPSEPLIFSDKARLGKLLFHDPRLSHDNTISCASCHNIAQGGDDGLSFSVGIGGAIGSRNSPTVLNATLNLAQFWDGRASSLDAQVAGPIHAANEMGSNWEEVIAKLNSDPEMKAHFANLYPDGITPKSITESIVSFEKLLITPNAPFDAYLGGDTGAVNQEVIDGYRLFCDVGCAACHQGQGVGGNIFEHFGVMRDFFESSENDQSTAMAVAQTAATNQTDKPRFKVPSLRNVELTGPYLHDGSAETLEDAIGVMSMYQLGSDLTAEEVRLLVVFLRSLTGVVSEELK